MPIKVVIKFLVVLKYYIRASEQCWNACCSSMNLVMLAHIAATAKTPSCNKGKGLKLFLLRDRKKPSFFPPSKHESKGQSTIYLYVTKSLI